MSDPSSAPSPFVVYNEDRVIPAVIYALYILGFSVLTIFVGLVLAYVHLGSAGPQNASHYIFQVRTFWTCAAMFLLGLIVVGVGGVLMVVLIGFPIFHLGLAIMGFAGIWFFIRSIVGVVFLAQGLPYPRPRSWFL